MSDAPFGHESSAIDVACVLKLMAALAGVLIVAVIILMVVRHLLFPYQADVATRGDIIPPAPRLQAHPQADLALLRARKTRRLASYAWANADHTAARIPVRRAMDLYVHQQSGLPAHAASSAWKNAQVRQ